MSRVDKFIGDYNFTCQIKFWLNKYCLNMD